MKKKVNSFVNGALILSVAGIIVKILGAIFRIPLGNIIGTQGMGLYQLAYPMYSFLLVISSSGFPVAISRLVAQAQNTGDYKLANRTFKLARKLMFCLGLTAMIIMLALSGFISEQQGNPQSRYALMAIAPAILFVTVMSAYRGYFQGMQNMVPTAVSQILEQFIKLVAGLGFAAYFVRFGVEWGAAGAVAGVTLSELVALIYVILLYNSRRSLIQKEIKSMTEPTAAISSANIIKDVLLIAVPVAIGSAIMPLVSLIDQLIVINGLKEIVPLIADIPYGVEHFYQFAQDAGESVLPALTMDQISAQYPLLYEEFITGLATSLYGIMSGYCSPITALPLIFSTSIAISIVPAISKAHARREGASVRSTTLTALKLTSLIAFPCAVGIGVMAEPIIKVLYSAIDPWEVSIAVNCLRLMALTVLVLPLIHSATAVLQGLGKQNLPVINLALGAFLLKIPLTYFLVKIPGLNVLGAAIGTISIYAFAALLDILCVKYFTRVRLKSLVTFGKPLVSSIAMGIVALAVYMFFSSKISSQLVPMGLGIVAGVVVYAVMVVITKMIAKDDLQFVPKSEWIISKFGRFLG